MTAIIPISLSAVQRSAPGTVLRTEVVPFGAHQRVWAPGTEAMHAQHGWVYIQFARGNRRQVLWYDVDDSCCEEPRVIARVRWVWIGELSPVKQKRPPLWERFHALGILKVPDVVRFPFALIKDGDADQIGLRSA